MDKAGTGVVGDVLAREERHIKVIAFAGEWWWQTRRASASARDLST